MTSKIKQFKKGIYYVKNPHKYMNKNGLPFCRSSWEYSFCSYLDNSPKVVKWASEPFSINYYDTVKHKQRKYFPDFFFTTIKGDSFLVEVKPKRETVKPRKGKNKSKKTMLYEAETWERNQCKWKSAIRFCEERGFIFKLITEKELFG